MTQPGRLPQVPRALAGLVAQGRSAMSGDDHRRPVGRREPEAGSASSDQRNADIAARPRYAYELDFFAQLTASLSAEVIGDTPDGYRVNFYITGGSVRGPRIDAELRAEGGDWMCIRPDGTGMVDINVTYETSDGALILDQAGGVFQLGAEGLARVKRGDFTGSAPFYAAPRWLTAAPAWTWLNSVQGFGFGKVILGELLVHCDMYIPRVVSRLDR